MEKDLIYILCKPWKRLTEWGIMAWTSLNVQQVARVLDIPVKDVELALDEREAVLREIERNYRENEMPGVLEAIKGLKNDIPEAERYDMRRRYLLDQLQQLKLHPNKEKEKKLSLEIKIFTGKIEGITPDMILKARQFPIGQLIKVNRGMALCPFHHEKTPSMDTRNNFYNCYGCGAHGDVIDLLVKRDGLTFKQAVMKLQ